MDHTIFANDLRQLQKLLHGQIDASEITAIKDFFESQCQLQAEDTPLTPTSSTPSRSHWHPLHEYEWTSEQSARAFFSDWWSKRPQTCNCSDSERILETNPMSFESEEAFFESGVRLHNAVNAKLSIEYPERHYPETSMAEAYAVWRGIAPRTRDRLLITVASGIPYKQLLKYSRKRFEEYAKRCDADYLEITNEAFGSWHKNKIRVGHYASQYSQTLFLDADCFPTRKCRNLFEASSGIAVVNDWNTFVRNQVTSWIYPEYEMVMRSQGREPMPSWERCLNSGVLLCSKEHNPWAMPELPLPGVHCAEQFWVDAHITEYTELPEVCNWQWWRGSDFWRGLLNAEVIHFANCPQPERLELMKWAVETF